VRFRLATAPIDTGAGITSGIQRATGLQFTAIDSNQRDWFSFRAMFFAIQRAGYARTQALESTKVQDKSGRGRFLLIDYGSMLLRPHLFP